MANLAALRAAVFSLSAKNLRGGGLKSTPPAGARDMVHVFIWDPTMNVGLDSTIPGHSLCAPVKVLRCSTDLERMLFYATAARVILAKN